MLLKFRKVMRQPIKQQNIERVTLDGNSLKLEELTCLARGSAKIDISNQSYSKLRDTRSIVEKLSTQEEPVYGITTGFGRFSNVKIPYENLIELQYNLIRSHSTGVGKLLSLDAARRVTALRINTLAKGFSGCSIETVTRLVDMFNSGVVPWIPDQGSVGASGDLVPLAHIGLGLIGEGLVFNPLSQKYEPAAKVFQEIGIKPAELKAKDGLSLINGTQFICGVGSTAVENALIAIKSSTIIAALSFLALKGHPDAFDERIQDIRIHYGQRVIGEVMRELLPRGKNIENQDDVQDPYSMRCITQVLGPSLEGIFHSKQGIEIEMNSGNDNPLVFSDKEPYIISGGNFHGEFPAKQLDVLAMYTHEIASISFMRAKRMLNPNKNLGMPAFLTMQGGVCSGLMTWENVAASLVSENKVLCHPSSIDTAETCADKEDHVSMGAFSARKAVTVADNVISVLAVELLAATHALQYRFQQIPEFSIHHPGLQKVYEHVKKISPQLQSDRYTAPEYKKLREYIASGEFWDTVAQYMTSNGHLSGFSSGNFAQADQKNSLKVKAVPRDEYGNLKYTKMRELQTQAGQLQKIGLNYQNISQDELRDAITYYQKSVNSENVVSILDASQDDIGARANFGRGNDLSNEVTAYDQFLQKFSNIQLNKYNKQAIEQCLLVGSIDIEDLKELCKDQNPAKAEERQVLIKSLQELDQRSRSICKTVFDANSKLFYMNGDHNNMGYIIGGFHQSRNIKPVVIYLDIHSDARVKEDGPHSGTWLTEVFERGECEKAYVIGMSLLSNSDAAINNLEKNNVSFREYTWDEIQRRGGSRKAIPQITENIIQDIRSKYGRNQPVIVSICADTVCGLPCSASNEVVGYPAEDIYPMMSSMIEQLNVECLNVSELKPSLDKTKNQASGEFLAYSLYLYSQTLVNKHQ